MGLKPQYGQCFQMNVIGEDHNYIGPFFVDSVLYFMRENYM